MGDRLQKVLSQWGVSSRRGAETLIQAGRVQLNGEIAQIGQSADPERDRIEVDGVLINAHQRPQFHYLLLHKPLGVVSTCDDPQGRRTVLQLLPPVLQRDQGLHPVGRLDLDSSGALLLTNDGEFTFKLTHPRHHIAKTYRVWVRGQPREAVLQQWRQGILLEGKKTHPATVKRLRQRDENTLLEVVLKEGRNRQIRKMAQQLGYPVLQLHRIAIGSVNLGNLPRGQCRSLAPEEVRALKTDESKSTS